MSTYTPFDGAIMLENAKQTVVKHWVVMVFVVIVVLIVLCQLGSISSKLSNINRSITSLSSKIYIGATNN